MSFDHEVGAAFAPGRAFPPGEGARTRAAGEPLPAVEDEVLARRAQVGDAAAFEELVLRHEKPLFGLAWRITGSAEDAEDAVQETFARAFGKLGSYQPERPFRPWLYRIAHNTAVSAARRRRPGPSLDDLEADGVQVPDASAENPADSAYGAELEGRFRAAVARLSPAHRSLFQMRYGEDMSIDEVAHATGKTANATAVALHRLRERIKQFVFDDGASTPETE